MLFIALAAGLIVGLVFYSVFCMEQAEGQPELPPGPRFGMRAALSVALNQAVQLFLLVPGRLIEAHVRRRILLGGAIALLMHTLGAVVYSALSQDTAFLPLYWSAMPVLLVLCLTALVLCNAFSANRKVLWCLLTLSFVGICLQISAGQSVRSLLLYNVAALVFVLLFAGFYKWLSCLPVRTMLSIVLGLTLTIYAVTAVFGTTASGTSTRIWLRLGPVSLQTSELTKMLALAALSLLLNQHNGLTDGQKMGSAALVIGLNIVWLVFLHEIGTCLLLCVTAGLTALLCLQDGKILLVGTAAAGGLAGAAYGLGRLGVPVLSDAYAKAQVRLAGFLTVADDTQLGYALQELRMTRWLGTSGLQSRVPVSDSDFVFTAVAMKLGMAVLLALVILYTAVLCFALKQKHPVWGICIVAQSLLALASATGFLPVIGIQPCLLGAGGSAYAAAWACGAMMLLDACRIQLDIPAKRRTANRKEYEHE